MGRDRLGFKRRQSRADARRAGRRSKIGRFDRNLAHSAAMRTDKRIKRTEIKIREISNKLRGMKLNVDVDDQPAVQDAIDKLEQFRNELFQSMFGSKSKD